MTSTAGKTTEHLEPSAMAHLRKARCAAFWEMGLTVSFEVISATAKQYSGATSGCSSKRKGTMGSHQPLCGMFADSLSTAAQKKKENMVNKHPSRGEWMGTSRYIPAVKGYSAVKGNGTCSGFQKHGWISNSLC